MKTTIPSVILGLTLLSLWLCIWFTPFASANNPFTTKQDNQQTPEAVVVSKSTVMGKVFLKIIVWQQYLKEKMTSLVRQAKADGNMKPMTLLILAAFAYGVIHAAGPGHGKAIALSYVLAQRPTYIQGLLFSNFMAFFHGISGIIFVLFIRFVLNTSIMGNLASVTKITQIVSYTIIACLGALIFLYSIFKLVKSKRESLINSPVIKTEKSTKYFSPILSAAVIGCIPCPGVVIVMIFALSMDLFILSIILGLAISIGMGFTISIVVLLAISGKLVSLNVIGEKDRKNRNFEIWIELFAGAGLLTLGLLFLGANL